MNAGQPVTFCQLEGADHGGPPFWQEPILDIVDEFIQNNFAIARKTVPH